MPVSRGREQEAEEGRGVPCDLIDEQLVAATRGVIRVRESESPVRKFTQTVQISCHFNERCGMRTVSKSGRQREGRRDVSEWRGLGCGLKLYEREERGKDFSYAGCFSRWLGTDGSGCA